MQLSHKKFEINRSYQLNNNLSIGSIRYLSKNDFDFDIYLHTKKCNLQRDLVWTDLQKQQLILSLLKEISIPKFAVIQKDSLDTKIKYKYLVIDGKQRLNTLFSFYNDEFYITVDNENYYFKDLDVLLQNRIARFNIIADVAYSYEENNEYISDNEIIEWFERINFAGTNLDIEHINRIKNA